MAILESALPEEAVFGFSTTRHGPISAADFETWPEDPDNPMELVEGWLLPMSPGTHSTGRRSARLAAALLPLVDDHGWDLSQDSRHRLPWPPDTVVYPDLVLHCVSDPEYFPGTETVRRVPDLVIELLSPGTAGRDRAPAGAKFLAYQQSGVREYYYAWPDGREAAGFRLEGGVYVPIESDAEGFFASPLLGARLRLVPAAVER
jgi:Uma2 family endonuclease